MIDGRDCHTIEFYYFMKIEDDISKCKITTDDGEALVWIPIDEIKNSEIKPSFVKDYIYEIITNEQIIHVIEEIDR